MRALRSFAAVLAGLLLFHAAPALAQQSSAVVVATCGTPPATYSAGANRAITQDTTGKLCTGATASGTTTVTPLGVTSTETAGTVTTHLTYQTALAASGTRKGCLIQNTSADTEYIFFGATGSATTAASLQVAPGATVSCVTGNIVLTDNVAISSKVTDGATYVVVSQ